MVAFGAVGMLGERAQRMMREGKVDDMAQGMKEAAKFSPLVHLVFIMIPALIFNPAKLVKTPMGIAAAMTAFWAVLLYVFFLAIFPSL